MVVRTLTGLGDVGRSYPHENIVDHQKLGMDINRMIAWCFCSRHRLPLSVRKRASSQADESRLTVDLVFLMLANVHFDRIYND